MSGVFESVGCKGKSYTPQVWTGTIQVLIGQRPPPRGHRSTTVITDPTTPVWSSQPWVHKLCNSVLHHDPPETVPVYSSQAHCSLRTDKAPSTTVCGCQPRAYRASNPEPTNGPPNTVSTPVCSSQPHTFVGSPRMGNPELASWSDTLTTPVLQTEARNGVRYRAKTLEVVKSRDIVTPVCQSQEDGFLHSFRMGKAVEVTTPVYPGQADSFVNLLSRDSLEKSATTAERCVGCWQPVCCMCQQSLSGNRVTMDRTRQYSRRKGREKRWSVGGRCTTLAFRE